jgi:hypothetical protein
LSAVSGLFTCVAPTVVMNGEAPGNPGSSVFFELF